MTDLKKVLWLLWELYLERHLASGNNEMTNAGKCRGGGRERRSRCMNFLGLPLPQPSLSESTGVHDPSTTPAPPHTPSLALTGACVYMWSSVKSGCVVK